MDAIYCPETKPWISEFINLGEYFDAFQKEVSHIAEIAVSKDHVRMKQCKLLGVDRSVVDEIASVCSADRLTCPDEPASGNAVDLLEAPSLYCNPGILIDKVPKLKCLKYRKNLAEKYYDKSRARINHRRAKYANCIFTRDMNAPLQFHLYTKEFIAEIRVYHPFTARAAPVHPRCKYEIAILGKQTLKDLREKITCVRDHCSLQEQSEHPLTGTVSAKDMYPSGFFYIEGTFYNDTSEDCFDYSEVIRDWAATRPKPLGPFKTSNMEIPICNLTVRFGYPYVYLHQGNCEHLIVFSDARLLHAEDNRDESIYPLVNSITLDYSKCCMMCKANKARWFTKNNARVPEDPFLFCQSCFINFNYTDNGTKKIGQFEAYQFLDRVLV